MKTEKSGVKCGVFKEMNSRSTSKPVKKLAPAIKTEASSDKENCVNGTETAYMTSEKTKILNQDLQEKIKKTTVDLEFEEKKKNQECPNNNKQQIISSDITCEEDELSDQYWEILAEKRRIALHESLSETVLLHKTIELLKTENETLKQALSEATAAIEILNEIVAECNENDELSSLA